MTFFKIRHIIYTSVTLLISSVALYLYTISILNPLDYYNKYDLQSGLFIASIELLFFLMITTFFLKKIIQKKWRIVLVVLCYAILLQEMFVAIVSNNLQSEFGATWTLTEIRLELVRNYKQTKLILIIATIAYFILLSLVKNKSKYIFVSDNGSKLKDL